MGDLPVEDRPYITIATRIAWEDGGAARLNLTSCRSLAAENNTSVSQRLHRVLSAIASFCDGPGSEIKVDQERDYPLYGTTSSAELSAYIDHLFKLNALSHGQNNTFKVTIDGWERLEPARRKGGTPGTCFVAMAFDPLLDLVYDDGIKAAIELDCHLKALRVDRVEHNGQITDQIVAGIRECEFMVADFTLHRKGLPISALIFSRAPSRSSHPANCPVR